MTSTGRPPLRRERIMESAVALADRAGLEAVSMRAVAAELGVVPMALYKHVADKDDLVGGMIDTVVAAYPTPNPSGPWAARVRAAVLGARAAMLRHPWMRPAIESRHAPTPIVLGHMEAIGAAMRDGGLSTDLVHHAMHAMGSRIWGISPESFAGAGAAAPDEATAAAVAARFPTVAAIAAETAATGGECATETEFAFVLDLLLDAIERLHATGWRSGRGAATAR